MTCHKQEDHSDQGTVEHQSCHSILVKPDAFYIFHANGINNMKDHCNQDQEHTESDCNDKYRI